jgi:protein-disulfide isomerase
MNFDVGDPSTLDAANAALCAADQQRFWDYHDRLFEVRSTTFAKTALKKFGVELGLPDTAKFDQCVDNSSHMDQVNRESKEGLAKGVEGTPTFLINGTKIVGDVPYDDLKQAVETALKG